MAHTVRMELQMQYALTSDGVRIAFAVAGHGPGGGRARGPGRVIVRVPGLPFVHSQLDYRDSVFFDELCARATVVTFDPRGTGLSDRDVQDVALEARLRDLTAVLEKLDLPRFTLHGMGLSGPVAVTYAAEHQDRVTHLVLDDTFARTADYGALVRSRAYLELAADWEAFTENVAWMGRRGTPEENERYAAYLRACCTPEMGRRIYDAVATDDVRDLLPRLRMPTLVLQHTSDANLVELARDLVARIPQARLVLLGSALKDDNLTVLPALEEFLGLEAPGVPPPSGEPHAHEHTLAPGAFRTILFTDVVGHTEIMRRLGDANGRAVLREHERITRDVLARHEGAEVKTTGDGFMASFASVVGGVECAIALQRAFEAYDWSAIVPAAEGSGVRGLSIRVGLNAGEPIAEAGDYFGTTVILAARIADQAKGGQILVSNVVRELCAGKGFLFADFGEAVLRGFEDPVRVFELSWQR